MLHSRIPFITSLFMLLIAACVSTVLAERNEKLLVTWSFDKDGDFRGWEVGGHIAEAQVRDGSLHGRATDWDPILLGPVFEIQAAPAQRVEIKMRATESGDAQLFWTETLEGKYGGFSEEKCSHFQVIRGAQFRTYHIYPYWHAAGKVIRLRLDPPNKGRFEIEWIRIVDVGQTSQSQARQWRFDADGHGWQPMQHVSEMAIRDGLLHITTDGSEPVLMSPGLAVSADDHPVVAIRMATDAGKTGRIRFASSTQLGCQTVDFQLRSDGKMHTYNVDMAAIRSWRDQIVMLGVQPTNSAGAEVRIESIEIADDLRGPPELDIAYFGSACGVDRAGRPATVTALIRNHGGETAENVAATLTVPSGVRIIGESQKRIDRVSLYLPKTVSWQVQSPQPGRFPFSLQLGAPGLEPVTARTAIEFTAAPKVPETDYIPEPRPVEAAVDVGVFYFPGWHSASRWQPILDFPNRKPVLGWYDEANPECADWQIKWAVEHGIKFFMVDWYWVRGHRHLEHWLHGAYMNARFRKHLKWAIMWANHNPPNTHSLEDWRNVTKYWIDNYFPMDEYYRIDDRPAVFIWSPRGIRNDVGGSVQATELYAVSQKMARDAGYKGIYFVAMSSHESTTRCEELKTEGYEAFTSYHGFQLAERRAAGKHFTFDKVVETSPDVWRDADQRSAGLSYIPIVDTGWASEPWHGGEARVISGRTPRLFGQLCQLAADYAKKNGKRIIAVGPCNEWGEGSYIEPYAEYGFADLDQLRQAFCKPADWPPNLIPADVGRGPYDLPMAPQKTCWSFDTDGDMEGWTNNSTLKVQVADGLLLGESSGHDPILTGPGVLLEADRFGSLVVRMRASADDAAQLFWGTALSKQSEMNSVRFQVTGDGEFHEYRVDLSQSRTWRGVIKSLRFDPAAKAGAKLAIDYIKLE